MFLNILEIIIAASFIGILTFQLVKYRLGLHKDKEPQKIKNYALSFAIFVAIFLALVLFYEFRLL